MFPKMILTSSFVIGVSRLSVSLVITEAVDPKDIDEGSMMDDACVEPECAKSVRADDPDEPGDSVAIDTEGVNAEAFPD
jgi:hypothetical protein